MKVNGKSEQRGGGGGRTSGRRWFHGGGHRGQMSGRVEQHKDRHCTPGMVIRG